MEIAATFLSSASKVPINPPGSPPSSCVSGRFMMRVYSIPAAPAPGIFEISLPKAC